MPYRRVGYLWVALVVSLVMIVTGGVWYTGWAVGQNNRKFCAVVGATVEGYRTAPPSTEVGRTQQRNAEKLYRDLGCE